VRLRRTSREATSGEPGTVNEQGQLRRSEI
jgi:hypothetical protein